MAQIGTYNQLATQVASFLNRGDLTSSIPVFVELAEAELKRADFERTVETTLTLSAQETALPADFRRLKSLFYDGTNVYGTLEIIAPNRLGDIAGMVGGTTGVPRYATVIDNNGSYVLRVVPAPDSATAYVPRIIYDTTFTALDSSNPNSTNWILTTAPDVYLYGTLVASAPFLKDDDRLAMWQTFFHKAIEDLRVALVKQKYSASPLVIRPRRALGG